MGEYWLPELLTLLPRLREELSYDEEAEVKTKACVIVAVVSAKFSATAQALEPTGDSPLLPPGSCPKTCRWLGLARRDLRFGCDDAGP